MRHVLEQVKGRVYPDEILELAARGLMVPQSSTVNFAAQRRDLGDTTIALLTFSAMRFNGGGLNNTRVVYIGFVLGGSITITVPGDEPFVLRPGGASAVNDWSAFEVESSEGTRCLEIMIPATRLEDRGVRVHHGKFKLEGSRSLRSPLRNLALSFVDSSWTPSLHAEKVAERTIEDLVVGMFLESEGYAIDSEDLRAGLRGRAITEIGRSHRTPTLTPGVLAERLAVSLRHLQRAFEDSGESIASSITRRRAESAALLLSAPGATSLTIEEVAKRAGFSSAFELRAAFRSHYAMLPSEFRENSLAASSYVPEQR